jgi:glycosyltransferase involved in cell wall biosynthesis
MKNVNTDQTQMQPSLSILLYSYNNEDQIIECIQSAQILTKSITLIDFESTDKTRQLAQEHDVEVITHPFIPYVEPARNFGMQKAESDWIFILDADERITSELAEEITQTIPSTQYTFFKVPRKEIFAKKKWLKHGGWWPNYQLRLIKKQAFVQWPQAIHSTPEIAGKGDVLKHPLLHYSQHYWS